MIPDDFYILTIIALINFLNYIFAGQIYYCHVGLHNIILQCKSLISYGNVIIELRNERSVLHLIITNGNCKTSKSNGKQRGFVMP